MAVTDDLRHVGVGRSAVRACERERARVVDRLDPACVALCDAAQLWKAFDAIERLAANAKVLLAARVHPARRARPPLPHDHRLKTNRGWLLVEGTGRRAFVGPDDPRHPRNKPPP